MQLKYLKISVAIVVMVTLFLSSAALTQASPSAQSAATAAATMADAGAYPPCPHAQPAPTMAATSSAAAAATMASTKAAMAATMAPTMAGTAMPASKMTVGDFQKTTGCTLTATLSGANEPPGKGEPKARGLAILVVSRPDTGTGEICFLITVSGLKLPATAAHIHAGAAGVAGPVVVPFAAPDEYGRVNGCTTGVDRVLIDSLLTQPFNYYVNVHNSDFPAGAERGQLEAPPK